MLDLMRNPKLIHAGYHAAPQVMSTGGGIMQRRQLDYVIDIAESELFMAAIATKWLGFSKPLEYTPSSHVAGQNKYSEGVSRSFKEQLKA
eukprot:803696-Pyramimonas_sp.AAC.1